LSAAHPREGAAAKRRTQPAAHAASRRLGNQQLKMLLRTRRLQAKLTVSDPHDVYEQEADRVADQVMRMPDAAPMASLTTSRVQRMCRDGDELLRSVSDMRSVPSIDAATEHTIRSLSGQGSPLPESVRAFMEPRFNADFSAVRMHTDGTAGKLAETVGAQAFTIGPNVVFGAGRYAPHTDSGKRLLAHELTHVVQQNGGSASPAAAPGPAAPHASMIQRAVSLNMSDIRHNLTYRFEDWAITDADARQVLEWLQPLSENDMQDTVAAMEREGLVDRLFDNVSDADTRGFADTLQRVQNNRVFTRPAASGGTATPNVTASSFTPDRKDTLLRAIATALSWLESAIQQLGSFIAAPPRTRPSHVGQALQRHFHTKAVVHARRARQSLRRVANFMKTGLQDDARQQGVPRAGDTAAKARSIQSECAAPTDPVCATAKAYLIPSASPALLRLCPRYFTAAAEYQAETIIHESAHAILRVHDRAYLTERVYKHLSSAKAFDNADSYSEVARELATGIARTQESAGGPDDVFADCAEPQRPVIDRALASAERMNMNAVNVLLMVRPGFLENYADLRRTHMGSDDPALITSWLERYQKARKFFEKDISIECETAGGACSGSSEVYHRPLIRFSSTLPFIELSSTLHICPGWFGRPPDQQIDSLFEIVLIQEGVSATDAPKFVALARAVTDRYWTR
jgi:hypothetical protein